MSKRVFWSILISVLFVVPAVLWFITYRTINTEKVLNNLYMQFDGISFVSFNYNQAERFGLEPNVISGVLHVEQNDETQKYNFLANKYTGEIMEITIQ